MKYEQFLASADRALSDSREVKEMISGMQAALSAVPDMVRKNERLENESGELRAENARLKAELNDWKGNAEGFQPDAYMKLPLDADGVPIRLCDKVEVDGDAMTVLGYRLHDGRVLLIAKDEKRGLVFDPRPSGVRHFKPEPPDSWEKLEKDASVGALVYCASRLDIDIRKTLTSDDDEAFAKDLIRRAKKLAGIGGEAQR